MSQFSYIKDATNLLNFAEQTIIQTQNKMNSSNNDSQEQLWLQQALGAVCRAKDVISDSMK
jgi:hypothetical protein